MHRLRCILLSPRMPVILTGIFLILLGLHLWHLAVLLGGGPYWKQFDLNREQNLPTYTESVYMLLCAGLLWIISRSPGASVWRWAWTGLAAIFVFLAADESFRIHERLNSVVWNNSQVVQSYDFLYLAWVVPYALLLLLFAGGYLRFWWRLPLGSRLGFAAAGAIFVAGAMGMEIIGAPRTKEYGRFDTLYMTFTTIEESLEYCGLILFFAVLQRHHRRHGETDAA